MGRRIYWTKDKIIANAKNFKYKNLWKSKFMGAYAAAIKLGIINECCSHMEEIRNPYKSGGVIYAFEFSDNCCYIGLSRNVSKRFDKHMQFGPISKKITDGYSFKFKILEHKTDYPIETQEKEVFWTTYYELNGWNLINDKRFLGSLGGMVRKWSKRAVVESSKKFSSVKEWREKEEGSYRVAKRMGIFDELSKGKKIGIGKGENHPFYKKQNKTVQGSRHGNSKLKEADVLKIREDHLLGESQRSISKRYKIDPSTVSDIVNFKRWGWLK